MNIFKSTDILLPKNVDLSKWAVIACDQFTSDPAYWQRVRANAGTSPSTINLILPEADLGTNNEADAVKAINAAMEQYLADGVFTCYSDSYVYIERTLADGRMPMILMWDPLPISVPPKRRFWSAFRPVSVFVKMHPLNCPMF